MSKNSKKDIIVQTGRKRHDNDIKRKVKNFGITHTPIVKSDKEMLSLSLPYRTGYMKFFDGHNSKTNDKSYWLVPKNFSLVTNFGETNTFLKGLYFSLFKTIINVEIDFKKCSNLSLGAATLLKIMLNNFFSYQQNYNASRYKKFPKKIKIRGSKDLRTNKMLFAVSLIDEFEGMEEITESSFLAFGLKTGSKTRSSFRENNKGRLCSEVNDFVNKSMSPSGYVLDKNGQRFLEHLLGEILGNAEDHSTLNTFYINGVSFKEPDKTNATIELNLVIVNFGYSIYEGFEETKEKNQRIYQSMEKVYQVHMKQLGGKSDKNYTKESLFTLYALQEGVSRLKYADSSRGNGTMNFIKAFVNLGRFGEDNKKYKPKLNLISGHTVIECTEVYEPYLENGKYRLSLNKEKDLKKVPDRKCIFANSDYFPGTILQVKIFMNEENFSKIVSENGR